MQEVRGRAALLLMAALLLGGCAPGGSPGTGTAPSGGASSSAGASNAAASITIKDFKYGEPLTVAPGAVVAVTNMDSAPHTVTAQEGKAFDVEVRGGGATASFTAPSKPGSYAYFCTYHPNMKGTLIVK